MDIDDLMMEAHEELIEEYLESHPGATEEEAYDATADLAYDRACDKIADAADYYHDMAMDR